MSDSDYMPISALQHILFCERQCALIHIEQQWVDNKLTVRGNILHERVDEGDEEKRADLIITRSIRLSSERFQISGIADRVDFFSTEIGGTAIPGREGLWCPVPVEYKNGVSKQEDCDRVQLCAQALCLEEMLDCTVEAGALFYWRVRRRENVAFDADLRRVTLDTIERLRVLFDSRKTPPPVVREGCKNCSLIEICQPKNLSDVRARRHFERLFEPEDA